MGTETIVNGMREMLSAAQAGTGTELPTAFGVVGVVILLVDLVNCFFGYRLFKIMVGVMGAILGIVAGAAAGIALERHGLAIVLMVVLAIVFAVLSYKVYQVGVFLFCGTVPAMLVYFLSEPLYALIVFVISGVLGVMLSRPYLIAISAIPSGLACGSVIMSMAGIDSVVAAFGIGAVLAVLGFLFQWKTSAKLPDEHHKEHSA